MQLKVKSFFVNQFYFIWFLCAIFHWIVGNYLMKDFYSYRLSDIFVDQKWFWLRITFFMILCAFYRFLFFWIHSRNKYWIAFSLAYTLINVGLLFLTWPGIWRWDEFTIYINALLQTLLYWQGYLTSLYYIFSIMFIPVIAAPIVVMIVINSFIVGYVISKAIKMWGKKGMLLFIPFLFFPVLDSNLYPIRMSQCAFLELLLIVLVYQYANRESIFKKQLFFLLFVAAIVTVWRSESIYYIFLFPLVLWLFFSKKLGNKKMLIIILSYFCMTAILFAPQYRGNKNDNLDNYDLTSTVLPILPLIEAANEQNDTESLEKLNQVINVELALDGVESGISGIDLYWSSPDFKREYNSEQYNEYKKTYYKLILRYPVVFLKERCSCFIHSNGFVGNTMGIFDIDGVGKYDWFRSLKGAEPFDKEIRKKTISILELRKEDNYYEPILGFRVVYNVIIPIVLLFAIIICLIWQKRIQEAALLFLVWMKVPLIFLTAPERYFMYYYAVYLVGYVVFAAFLIDYLGKKLYEKKQEKEIFPIE